MVMRNRILAITRGSIPYVPELRPITGSVTATILMQQLDYWFERMPEGFYKFQDASPDNPAYKVGDSWVEELNFSVAELRNAFDLIGHRHKSKTDWAASSDPFHGKFYCCYTDRRTRLTYYFRNHAMVDAALDALVVKQGYSSLPGANSTKPPIHAKNAKKMGNFHAKAAEFPVSGETRSPVSTLAEFPVNAQTAFTGNDESGVTVNAHSHSIHVDSTHSPEMHKVYSAYTETTGLQKTTQRPQQQLPATPELLAFANEQSSSSCHGDNIELWYPQAEPLELEMLAELIMKCRPGARQAVLDELEGARQRGNIRSGLIPFAFSLCKSEASGTFTPSAGIAVAAARARAKAHSAELQVQSTTPDTASAAMSAADSYEWTEEDLQHLPPKMRSQILSSLQSR